ncbi:3'-5' exonuclease [Bdellovibrio svalbardensis]|uniref:3'-5' exonuclease n=1 Tax=Bdellovibrio svalbardensis TaxID=2972972 RepID=A0ABT6DMP1_9BACT|nr:3'-5' exonuclease [Bdellovibrio svalbardensis]MDG0816408.1 3'-5' exonuclease [Bdellovibrio svalbardensis]
MAFRWIGKSEDGKTVTLRRLEDCQMPFPPYATSEWIKSNVDIIRVGAVLDVETTGLNQNEDVIIELGLRQFLFNKNTGEILKLGKSYSSFQDPERELPKEIVALTGITDEMVAGQKIDWEMVNSLIHESAVVIAHNARFDRPFIDKKSKPSTEKIWACSLKQIDWNVKGYFSSKLELLNIYHGFFTDSHRALNDADALLYLLSQTDPATNKPYFFELANNAKRLMTQVVATAAPFDAKDHLKGRGYNWDSVNRFWAKTIFKDDVPAEISWLEDSVYCGPFGGITRDIALTDGFKN